jgi:hypothetical protein
MIVVIKVNSSKLDFEDSFKVVQQHEILLHANPLLSLAHYSASFVTTNMIGHDKSTPEADCDL